MIRNGQIGGYKVLGLILGLAVAFFAVGVTAASAQPETLRAGTAVARAQGPVPGQYIVVFKDGVANSRAMATRMGRQHGFRVLHSYQSALSGFAARMPASVAAALAGDPNVALVEADLYTYASVHGMPTGVSRIGTDFNVEADIDHVDSPRVDVDIAIIDTGIDLDHPDLNVHDAVDCTKGPNCPRGGDGNDDNGHGTHVAGTTAALDDGNGVMGVAPGARLWGVKVLRSDGSGFVSDMIQGLDYVAANAGEIEVANMSLSATGRSTALRSAVQSVVASGVVLVAAAGNSGRDVFGLDGVYDTGDDVIPAAYPEVMTVSAMADSDGETGGMDGGFVLVDGNGNVVDTIPDDTMVHLWNFSRNVAPGNPVTSPGAAIDVAGPGVLIESTWNNGGYNSISGTSMATPHVTGAVALHIAANARAGDAAGVHAIRQALIGAAEAQADWGVDNTKDPDNNPEGLVNVAPVSTNATPSVIISNPFDGEHFNSGDTVTFAGSATDIENGDLTSGLIWKFDGVVVSGSAMPSDGVHVITAEATDDDGATGSATATISVGNFAPTVAITAPGDGDEIFSTDGSAFVTFAGNASDVEDGSLTGSISWSSSLAGDIGTGGNPTNVQLADGTHTITATVSDSVFAEASDSITITVLPQPVGPTAVASVDIRHFLTGNSRKPKVNVGIVLLDDMGDPVAGASVSIQAALVDSSRVWGGTGTTGSNGTVNFKLIKAPGGSGDCYDTTVTGITSNLDDSIAPVVATRHCF